MSASFERFRATRYWPALDGVRAIAVLLVITAHLRSGAWAWLHGPEGVTLFFVLSGFLITTLALREETEGGGFDLRAFVLRRVFRLFPVYYVVLGIYALLILGVGTSPEKRAHFIGELPYLVTYLQDVLYYGRLIPKPLAYTQTWSLGIEEKFYLVWPLLAFVVLGVARHRTRARLVLVGTLALASVAIPLLWPSAAYAFAYYAILIGCGLALLLHDGRGGERLAVLARPTALVTLTAILAIVHFTLPAGAFDVSVNSIAYAPVFALILAALVLSEGGGPRWLRSAPLVLIGELSYGIYLIHLLCVNVAERVLPQPTGLAGALAEFAAVAALSVAAAYALNVSVERPMRAVGRRLAAREPSVAVEPAVAQ